MSHEQGQAKPSTDDQDHNAGEPNSESEKALKTRLEVFKPDFTVHSDLAGIGPSPVTDDE